MNIGNFFKRIFGGQSESDTTSTSTQNFSSMKVSELREIAKARGLKGWTKLRKSELVEFLNEA